MKISRLNIIQLGVLVIIISILIILINNIVVNITRAGIGFGYNWLFRPAGFALAEHTLPYSPSDSYIWALFMGWLNSLKVILVSLILATFIGFFVGLARNSRNILIQIISAGYITIVRQTPLLLQLMFWYFVGFLGLKDIAIKPIRDFLIISNQGIYFLGIDFSAEFAALFIGLSIFTGAYIAEVVRGGINSVPRGQWESFRSLGISENMGLYKIIIPQALPAIIPGLTSQYLNLAKNSTLAIAVGYADIYAVNDTIINQTGKAIECFILLLLCFLSLNILISKGMEMVNDSILRSRKNF